MLCSPHSRSGRGTCAHLSNDTTVLSTDEFSNPNHLRPIRVKWWELQQSVRLCWLQRSSSSGSSLWWMLHHHQQMSVTVCSTQFHINDRSCLLTIAQSICSRSTRTDLPHGALSLLALTTHRQKHRSSRVSLALTAALLAREHRGRDVQAKSHWLYLQNTPHFSPEHQ